MTEDVNKVAVRFAKQCNFLADDGIIYTYLPGFANIPEAHANHWFVQLHMEDAPEVPPAEGSYEYGIQLQNAARKQKETAQLDEQQLRQLEASRAEADRRALEQRQQRLIASNAKKALEAQRKKDNEGAPSPPTSDDTPPAPTQESKPKGRIRLRQ